AKVPGWNRYWVADLKLAEIVSASRNARPLAMVDGAAQLDRNQVRDFLIQTEKALPSLPGGTRSQMGKALEDIRNEIRADKLDGDARKLDHKTLEEMRARAVGSVQNGQSPEVVAQALGINRTTIYDWLAKYRRGGWGALKAKPVPGRPPKLSGHGHAEKSIAVEVRVRTLDAGDDRQANCG